MTKKKEQKERTRGKLSHDNLIQKLYRKFDILFKVNKNRLNWGIISTSSYKECLIYMVSYNNGNIGGVNSGLSVY